MPLRTRVFARVTSPFMSPVDAMAPSAFPSLRRRRSWVQRTRLAWLLTGRPAPGCEIDEVNASCGRPRLRVYRPGSATGTPPVVAAFHGGGFALGDVEQTDWLCSQVAERTGAVVVSPDYRLAPEHPYPAAVDDCWDTLAWVYERPEHLGVDRDRIAVMGESAGGNLAAVVALRSRDSAGPPIRLQALLYPAVDMLETFDSERRYADGPILTSVQMKAFARLYLDGADGSEPYASPLRADLRGVAPALVQTAEFDPLRDHGTKYAEALSAAGVRTRATCYRGAVHGFLAMSGVSPPAHQAVEEVAHELSIALR